MRGEKVSKRVKAEWSFYAECGIEVSYQDAEGRRE
jgi:hypothetical protein